MSGASDPVAWIEKARALSGLTPWATAFRYPADDPMTAEPLPARDEVERHLNGAEALVEAVAERVFHPPPTA